MDTTTTDTWHCTDDEGPVNGCPGHSSPLDPICKSDELCRVAGCSNPWTCVEIAFPDAADSRRCAAHADPNVHRLASTPPAVRVVHQRRSNEWVIETTNPAARLLDDEAGAVTFRAEPQQVTLGRYVEVRDAGGVRIGHVSAATYRERAFGPSYVVVSIELR